MPRYFFDVDDGMHSTKDLVGTMLPDDTAARNEATQTLTEIAAETIPRNGAHIRFRIVVRDEGDRQLFEVAIRFDASADRNGGPA